MKVLILIPTKNTIDPECLASVYAQDYENFSVMVNKKKADPKKTYYQNVVENRIELREKGLKTDADYFLWVDSDIILPPDAVTAFLKKPEPLMGGYYPIDATRFCVGKIKEGILENFTAVTPEKTEVDHIAFGMMIMSREVLEKVKIRDCTKEPLPIKENPKAEKCDCGGFCEDAKKQGYKIWALPIAGQQKPRERYVKVKVSVLEGIAKGILALNQFGAENAKFLSQLENLALIEE